MTALPFDPIVSWIGGRLLEGSVEAVILVSLVWFACRRANLSATMQATLWWLVALKLVIVLLPLPAITLPLLPAPTPVQVPAADVVADRTPAQVSATSTQAGAREAHGVGRDPQRGPGWTSIAVIVWLFAVIVHALRLFGQHLQVRRVIRRSVPSGDEVGPLASAVGLRRIPAVHSSSDIDAPQVVGVVRPMILLPSAPMAESDRMMALSHELMHVRRGDLALGWIPAIAERLFFFHPLVRLAGREYHTAREAACDAAVVQALGIAAGDYGRLLVRFGVSSGQPAFVAGGASRSMSSLKRRLAMLQQSSSSGSRRIGWALGAVMLLAMIPIQLVAQAPSNRSVRLQADVKAVTVVSTAATPEDVTNVEPRVILVPAPAAVLESTLEPVETLVAQEPKQSTEEILQQQLLEAQKALRAAQAEDAARTNREKRRQAEIEAILKSIEEQGSRGQAAREVDQRARDIAQALSEVAERTRNAGFEQRAREEYEKMLNAERQKQDAVNQQEVTAAQLDNLRRSIDELNVQLQEMRKMEQRLRGQLNGK